MPLYEYECEACGQRFEKIRKFSDPPLEVCDKCGKGPVKKLFSSPAIQFKGSGFYINDYAKKSSSDSGGSKSAAADSGESKKADAPAAAASSTPTPSDKKESTPKKD
ncbi:MAG TPA: zinc ribbon domain-containing protein [Vicinamibacterales bacterium]|jgi:putative FmdB family regulatory protein